MLMNCPRCGFSQPKDQYCAQCGVDMEAFKPKAEPLLKIIFRSTTTHVLLLLVAAIFAGQYIIRSENPQRWVQKMTRFQGVNKSKAKFQDNKIIDTIDSASEADSSNLSDEEQLQSLKSKEISVNANKEQPIQVAETAQRAAQLSNSRLTNLNSDISAPTFRILYAEVPIEKLASWISESSGAGLYQILSGYSAGILGDFRKKLDADVKILKVAEKKLALGQSDSIFSGNLNEDGSQLMGISASIEFRSNEGGSIHGNVVVGRTQRQIRENFPAEFDLPKSSVFYMVGVLKNQSFGNERLSLTMPPFQIFKSNEFMTRKTEFVIIVEPEYK